MPYNLLMSPAQIARCNRALPAEKQLSTTRITHTWNDRSSEEEVVLLNAEGVREVVTALRASPEDGDRYPKERFQEMSLEELNVADLDATLESVLEDPEDTGTLFGICL